MRPRAIILFERLLLAALAIDLINNLASWSTVAAKIAARGVAPNPVFILLLCLASPLVGFAFWYLIARRGSVIAKWVMTIFVALATIGFASTMVAQTDVLTMPMFLIGLAGELLKLAAVAMLFTKDAARWFSRAASGA